MRNDDFVPNSPVEEIVGACIAVRARLIGRSVASLYDRALEVHGLGIAQVDLLAAVGRMGPCRPAQVGDILQLDRSTVSRNLSLLRKHGWIEAVSSDAKGMREVALTAAGRKKLQDIMPEWRQAQAQAAELLGADGVKAIRALAASVGQLPDD